MDYEITFENAKPLKFANAENLLSWIEEEYRSWEWVDSAYSGLWREISPQFVNIISHCRRVIDGPKNDQADTDLQNALRNLQVLYDRGSNIYSKSNLAQFIFSEREGSESFAGQIAFIATRPPNTGLGNSKGTFLAVCALSEFQRGISKKGASASIKTSEKVRVELEALIKDGAIATEERISTLDRLIELREQKNQASTKMMAITLGKQKSSSHAEQHKLRTETKDATDKLIATVDTEVAQIKDFYENQIALQEPIQYWTDKSTNHMRATVILAMLFIDYSTFAGMRLFEFISGFEGGIEGFIVFWKDASIPAFASFAGLVGLGMVFARILYRLFASQLHLWNDARERVVMIQTYLAMAQKEHVKDEFLGALLHRLFSPSTDGIVKSDLGSVSVLDAALSRVGGS